VKKSLKAFTLIELLIVVAIIAILAAIAVPNFLEAQTRSKVSRAKADMRTYATGLESYYIDNNSYPKGNWFGYSVYFADASGGVSQEDGLILERLSTPIAYLTTGLFLDPFTSKQRTGTINPSDGSISGPSPQDQASKEFVKYYKYYAGDPTVGQYGSLATWDRPDTKANHWWVVNSSGPDLIYPNMSGLFRSDTTNIAIAAHVYDATNGTISFGSLYRIGGTVPGKDKYGGPFVSQINAIQGD
jgi:general secretion pathway protein G